VLPRSPNKEDNIEMYLNNEMSRLGLDSRDPGQGSDGTVVITVMKLSVLQVVGNFLAR